MVFSNAVLNSSAYYVVKEMEHVEKLVPQKEDKGP